MADRELRDYFTSEEANRALEDIILTYGDRLNSILLQDYETRLKREVERQVEGQQLTLKFPDLIGQRVVRRNSIWFEVHAEPKIEYIKRSAVSGLFKKRTRLVVETVHHQDRFRSIRIVIRAKGWPERVHTLTYDKRNNLEQTMAAAQTDLQELVSLLLKEEYPV